MCHFLAFSLPVFITYTVDSIIATTHIKGHPLLYLAHKMLINIDRLYLPGKPVLFLLSYVYL